VVSVFGGTGQPASTDARDPGECRPDTEHPNASPVELALAGVERLAVADREPECRSRRDREQRRNLSSVTADPWRGSTGIDSGRIGFSSVFGVPAGVRTIQDLVRPPASSSVGLQLIVGEMGD
jgi:hypothetical protein